MTSTLPTLERALRDSLLGAEAGPFDGVPPGRLRAMRRLVQNNLRRTIARALPHTTRLCGDAAFDALVTRFLAEALPSTRVLREVPAAFQRFLATLPEQALPHRCCVELAHWEVVEIEVLFAPDPEEAAPAPDAIVAHPSARLCAYRFDVMAVDEATRAWPGERDAPALILCFRVRERVRWRLLSGACARVLAAVGAGASARAARALVAVTHHAALDEELRALLAEGALQSIG